MYLWKTSLLYEEIKENRVPEDEWKKYILVWLIVHTLTLYMMSSVPYENTGAMLFELIGTIGVIIFGIGSAYKANNSNGFTFIPRFVALSIPLFVRLFVLTILGGIFVGVLGETVLNTIQTEWVLSILVVSLHAI